MKLGAAAPLVAALFGAAAAGDASSISPDFDHLRKSVIRIQAVSQGFDWLNPFLQRPDQVGLGSGFVVQTEPYPLFVTNAHVVNDAHHVALQLLLYGEEQWQADVVSICHLFDLALLVLHDPLAFNKAMASQNITLQALKLHKGQVSMGEDVVALGFPLGQDTLKISKGNVAGNEDVDGNICIQSTAPISPGNSGGPLLDAAASEVIGVNFAKATEGENINYVIPAWRVEQIVAKHLKDSAAAGRGAEGPWPRGAVRVPRADLTAIESNEALYALSAGCSRGVYLARVGRRSFLQKARPPVTEGSFLLSVNGKDLDRFGMGRDEAYVADRVDFKDLFFMADDLSADVEFETCYQGKSTKHLVSMSWNPDYDQGLRWVEEPHNSGVQGRYEMFGDLSVMEMTVNHISAVLSTMGDPGPARWMHPEYVAQPRLIVNYVRSGSYAADVVPVGSAVAKVNGHEVRTLEEFKEHFIPEDKSGVWTMTTDVGKIAAVMFNKSLAEQLTMAKSFNAGYLLTPSVVLAAEKLGFTAAAGASQSLRGSALVGEHAVAVDAPHASKPSGSIGTQRAKKAALLFAASMSALAPESESGGAGTFNVVAAGPLLVRRSVQAAARTTRVDAMPWLWERV